MSDNEMRGQKGMEADDLGLGPTQRQGELDRGETRRPMRPPTAPADNLSEAETIRGRKVGDKVFNGRYELKRILGRGGMGVVWLAQDKELDHEVALKFLPEVMAYNEAAILELKRETKKALLLTHPHIVRIHGWERDTDNAAVSMEYVDGRTLATLKAERETGCLDVVDIRGWVRQLCEALEYAHTKAKVVHRDLKPQNLMLNGKGDLKITDFGISRSLEESVSRTTRGAHGFSGTLAYMSPQQLGSKPSEPADDLYALGATIYELLTGKPPFYGGNLDRQIREETPPSMAQRRGELGVDSGQPIPGAWERIVAACLAKEPGRRPASARAAWEQLESKASESPSQDAKPATKQQDESQSKGLGDAETKGQTDTPNRPATESTPSTTVQEPASLGGQSVHASATAGVGTGALPKAGKGKWLALAAAIALALAGGWFWYAKIDQPRRARAAELARLDAAKQQETMRLRGEVEAALSRGDLKTAEERLAALEGVAGAAQAKDLRSQYEAKAGEREVLARFAEAKQAREGLTRQNLDRGQGMGAKLDALDAAWAQAEKAMEIKSWKTALSAYEDVLKRVRDVAALQVTRTQAQAAQAQSQRAAMAAEGALAAVEAKELWDAAQRYLQQAQTQWEGGNFGEAKTAYEAAEQQYAGAQRRAEQRQQERGMAQEAKRKAVAAAEQARANRAEEDAREEWQQAEAGLKAADGTLERGDYPAAKAAYEATAGQYARAGEVGLSKRGDLVIEVDPGVASYEVQNSAGRLVNKGVGTGELKGLAVGQYQVKAVSADLGDTSQTVEVKGRGRAVAKLALPYGSLRVTSEPSGASILQDGKYLGATPLTLSPLRPGWVGVQLQLNGYKPSTLGGTVTDGGTLSLTDSLAPESQGPASNHPAGRTEASTPQQSQEAHLAAIKAAFQKHNGLEFIENTTEALVVAQDYKKRTLVVSETGFKFTRRYISSAYLAIPVWYSKKETREFRFEELRAIFKASLAIGFCFSDDCKSYEVVDVDARHTSSVSTLFEELKNAGVPVRD